MPITFYAADEEFAAASGSNVNVTDHYSYFDHPPNSTADLTITSNAGDDDARLFDVGDAYDITWTGHGGGSMDDAVVIRSDYLGPGEGAIIFEGTNDTTGELYQVAWTPGFDLESWYWGNGGGPSSPNAFWTSDVDPEETARFVCFGSGTRIAVPGGEHRLVETLVPGDKVHTVDHGPQPVLLAEARQVRGVGRAAPVIFDTDAIANTGRLVLSQAHRVLLSSPLAEVHIGASEVFVPAKALVNNADIRIEPQFTLRYHHLLLANHAVLLAEGAPCESLLIGPATHDLKVSEFSVPDPMSPTGCPAVRPDVADPPMRTARPVLSYREARMLARLMGIVPAELPSRAPALLFAA